LTFVSTNAQGFLQDHPSRDRIGVARQRPIIRRASMGKSRDWKTSGNRPLPCGFTGIARLIAGRWCSRLKFRNPDAASAAFGVSLTSWRQ
jgi:hypothetical protein